MNILFLTLNGINNLNEKGIYTDLLRKFKEKGHNIFIISPREKRSEKRTELTVLENVHYLNVRIGNITKVNNIEKGISTLTIEQLYLRALKKYLKGIHFDLLIYSTPPITFGRVVSYIKKRDNAKSYLLLKDIFPQNAVDLEMFSKKSLLYKYFRAKEKKLYNQSDYIGCMSQANVEFILKHNSALNEQAVEVSPNSIEPFTVHKDRSEVEKIREKYQIPLDKTVLIYGGNLGKPQGIEFLIECLAANEKNENVYFVIAGSGTEFPKIKSYFEKRQPSNAQLLSQLPQDDYETLATSCDVGLIFLDHRFTIPNFPSRLLSYMHASMPVLAATDSNTDIGKVIEEGKFGFWCESNDVSAFNQKLLQLYDVSIRKEMGKKAREYLEANYTTDQSYDIIMNHFK